MAGINYDISMLDFQKRYEKLDDLARTGMSNIWLARDRRYDRKIVIKFFNPKKPKNMPEPDLAEFRERFEQEAKIAAQLVHPNVVPVYDYGTCNDNKIHYIVSEYVEGKNLESALHDARKNDSFLLDDFLVVFYQICDPIDFAHKKGNIVHRDLKPLNVLLGKNGRIVVCDWGISKILQRGADDDSSGSKLNLKQMFVTAPDVMIGTPSYLSPEQIRGQPVDKRTDVYQLGAILYQGITGIPPFSSRPEAIDLRAQRDDHSYLMPKGLDPALESILVKSLQAEKEDRHQSVCELQKELKAYLDEMIYFEESQITTLSRIFRKSEPKKRMKKLPIASDIVKSWAKEA